MPDNPSKEITLGNEIRIFPVSGFGEIQPGADLAALILAALAKQQERLESGDILVVTQKIVSKAEGSLIDLKQITPSAFAQTLAAQGHKDARYYEVILQQSQRIVKMDRGILITETAQGWICANAGVDESNVNGAEMVTLLPKNPDQSAFDLRKTLNESLKIEVAVIISDTFGRPWREGQVNVAIGVAGLEPLSNYKGVKDTYGFTLQASLLAVADELASAAELVMGKIDNIPVAIIRGYAYAPSESGAKALLRDPKFDLFR